jgi:hypothetical protein
MKWLAVAAVTLVATACGQKDLSADTVRAAIPLADDLRITAPDPTSPTGLWQGARGPAMVAAPGAQAVAGTSPLAVASWNLATAVNGGVYWTLAPIAWFTRMAPSARCDPDACTWGPGSEAVELNVWKLVVAKKGDAFEYSLFGAPKSTGGTAFVTVLHGKAWPGAQRNRGTGGFEVDFESAWGGLDHPGNEVRQDFGSLTVSYDLRAELLLLATFYNARNANEPGLDPANPNRVNAAYAFGASAAGGDLQVGWRTLPAGVTERTVALQTRWLAGSGGRADLVATTGSATTSTSECWGGPPLWTMTYDSANAFGLESSCVFPIAAPPTITVP